MNKIIFFDLDGTLIDPKKRYHVIHEKICNEIGVIPLSSDEYWELKRNKVYEDEILLRCGSKDNDFEEVLKARSSMLEDKRYLLYDTLHDGVAGFIEKLSNDFILVLVTYRKRRNELEEQLNSLGIAKYFDNVLSISPAVEPKYMGKVNLIQDSYGNAVSGIFFGDTEVDILAGKHLKVTTVACLNGIRSHGFLKKVNPEYFIHSWDVNNWDNKLISKIEGM